MLSFDPTLTFGAILNAAVLAVGFIVAFVRIGNRIDLLTLRMTSVEETMKNNRDVNTRIAIIETRQSTHGQMIVNIQNEQMEMKHGRGFIRGSGGLDGEYPKT